MDKLVQISYSIDTNGNLPNEIRLLPLGLVKSQKGNFLVDNESFYTIEKRFREREVDIPIDYEHQTLQDVQAPAAGWIKNIILKEDGIYGQVEWTPKAKEYLQNKEYRYLSPVVNVGGEPKKAFYLHSVALTNTPAIDGMTAIVNKGGAELATVLSEDDERILKSLREMLELPETATADDIVKAVEEAVGNLDMYKAENMVLRSAFQPKPKTVADLLGLTSEDMTQEPKPRPGW